MTQDRAASTKLERATDGVAVSEPSSRDQRLAHTTAAGVAWPIAQNVSAWVIRFGSQIVLARILQPDSFGEFTLATTLTTLVGVLISFGGDDVLLQRLNTIRFWTAPAFWMSLGAGVLGMIVVCGAAPWAARLYGTPQLAPILFLTALSMPLGALSTVPAVMLRSALRFRFVA